MSDGSVTLVLLDASLLAHIVSFQRGLPADIIEKARAWRSLRCWRVLPRTAIINHDVALLQRLYRYYREQPALRTDKRYTCFQYVWRYAIKHGDLATIKWVDAQPALRDGSHENTSILTEAIKRGDISILAWLMEHRPKYKNTTVWDGLRIAAWKGDLRLFLWLEANVWPTAPYNEQVAGAAAASGNIHLVRHIFGDQPRAFSTWVMDFASGLEVIQYLHQYNTSGCTHRAMDNAARRGQLDVVKFLHEHRSEGCTTDAMDWAAAAGHLDVVRFLHENRTEGCTAAAMDHAKTLAIAQFLHSSRNAQPSGRAIEHAAAHGRLSIVEHHLNHGVVYSIERSLTNAARGGHVQVVRRLCQDIDTPIDMREVFMAAAVAVHLPMIQFFDDQLENGSMFSPDFYREVSVGAARHGRKEIIQYLYEADQAHKPTRSFHLADAHRASLVEAAKNGHLDIVRLLHKRDPPRCDQDVMHAAAGNGHAAIVRYLLSECDQRDGKELVMAATFGHLHVVQLLVDAVHSRSDVSEAYDAAEANNHPLVVEYLSKALNMP